MKPMAGLVNRRMTTNATALVTIYKAKIIGNTNTTKSAMTNISLTQRAGRQPSAPTKPSPLNSGVTILKTTLVVGSIVATLLGANLAALQEQANTAGSAAPPTGFAGGQLNPPRSLATLPNLPANSQLGEADIDALLNMPLAPIPSIAIPAPMTRSRSSR